MLKINICFQTKSMAKYIKRIILFFITFLASIDCFPNTVSIVANLQQLIDENKYVEAYHLISLNDNGNLPEEEQLEIDYLWCVILKNAYENSYEPHFKSLYVGKLEELLFNPTIYVEKKLQGDESKFSELIKDLSLYYKNVSNSIIEELIKSVLKSDIPIDDNILLACHYYYEYLVDCQRYYKFYFDVTLILSDELSTSEKYKIDLARILQNTSLALYFDYSLKDNDHWPMVISRLLEKAQINYGEKKPYDLNMNYAIFYSEKGNNKKALRILKEEEKAISQQYGREGIEYAWYLFHEAMVYHLDDNDEFATLSIKKAYDMVNNIPLSEEDIYKYLYISNLYSTINLPNTLLRINTSSYSDIGEYEEYQVTDNGQKSLDYYTERIRKICYELNDTDNKLYQLKEILRDLEQFSDFPISQYLECISAILYFAENSDEINKEFISLPNDMYALFEEFNKIEDENKTEIFNLLLRNGYPSEAFQIELSILAILGRNLSAEEKFSLLIPLADVHYKNDNWSSAKKEYQIILKHIVGTETYTPLAIKCLANLSSCYLQLGERDSCAMLLDIVDASMSIKLNGENLRYRIETYNILGDIYNALDNPAKALTYYSKVNELSGNSFALLPFYYDASYKMSEILYDCKRYKECAELLIPLCSTNKRIDNFDNSNTMLIKSLTSSNDLRAFEYLQKYVDYTLSEIIPCYFTEMSQFERDQLWSFKSSLIIELCTEVAHRFKRDDINEYAYNNIIYVKSLDIEAQKLIREEIGKKDDYLQKAYKNLLAATDSLHYGDPKKKMIYKNRVAFAQSELYQIVKDEQLWNKNRNLYSRFKTLDENTAVVEYVLIPNDNDATYFAYIAQKDSNCPQLVKICNSSDLSPHISTNKDDINKLYTDNNLLHDLLWRKVEECFDDSISDVILVPTGILNRINFSAIPYDDGRLSQKYRILRVSNTASLFNNNQSLNKQEDRAALFGGIKYDLTEEEIIEESQKYVTKRNTRTIDIDTDRGRIRPLPATYYEIKEIGNQLVQNGYSVGLFTEKIASEGAFKQLSGNSPRIIHIASHGFYLDNVREKSRQKYYNVFDEYKYREKSLLYSGILLSGSQYSWNGKKLYQGVEDGILTADEISRMDLSGTSLVVLSACETALGDIDNTEGVIGLQRAFKKAGADVIVMSLWPVGDIQTANLMNSFYAYLMGGETIYGALQKAMEQLRKQYSDPVDWAGFIIMD